MSDTGDAILETLRSIDGTLKALLTLAQRRQAATRAPAVATDRDLDGPHGNPKVKFNPRDWTGNSYKGRLYSECPHEYLELLAEALDYFAGKDEEQNKRTSSGRPAADYPRRDAARARGWAARKRAGWEPAAAPETAADWSEETAPEAGTDGWGDDPAVEDAPDGWAT